MRYTQLGVIGATLLYNPAKADILNNITYQEFSKQCTKIEIKNNPELIQTYTKCTEDLRAFSVFKGVVNLYEASLSEQIRQIKVGCLNLKNDQTFNSQDYHSLELQLSNENERAKIQYERLTRIIEIKFPKLLNINEYHGLKIETNELFGDTINFIDNFECPYY